MKAQAFFYLSRANKCRINIIRADISIRLREMRMSEKAHDDQLNNYK